MMNNKEQDKNCAPAARRLWKRNRKNMVQNLVEENIIGNGKEIRERGRDRSNVYK
jgi:hypothetical protein